MFNVQKKIQPTTQNQLKRILFEKLLNICGLPIAVEIVVDSA